MQFGNKTNLIWYKYPDMGCYYKLVNGALCFAPASSDGTRGEDAGEVEFEILKGDYIDKKRTKLVTDRLTEIGMELVAKNRVTEMIEALVAKDIEDIEREGSDDSHYFIDMILRTGFKGYEEMTVPELLKEYGDRKANGDWDDEEV